MNLDYPYYMVRQNNSYLGSGSPEMAGYLRNLNEFRISLENTYLYLIDYFIAKTESDSAKVVFPGGVLGGEEAYLKELARRYYKRDFEFVLDPAERLNTYDYISKLVRKSRKAQDYCLADTVDFMAKSPEVFEGTTLPKNLVGHIKSAAERFDKTLPATLEQQLADQQSPHLFSEHGKKTTHTKPEQGTPFTLYLSLLSGAAKGIDFEALKLYDFLIEQDSSNSSDIKSAKLYEIYPEIRNLGEGIYEKLPLSAEVLPISYSSQPRDRIIDEWAANIRRILELKRELALDLVTYLSESAEPAEKLLFRLLQDEIIRSLPHLVYGQELPPELKPIPLSELGQLAQHLSQK